MRNALIIAIVNEDVQSLKTLLNNGADPNVVEDSDKITALHFVAQSSADYVLEMARLLLQAGADPHAQCVVLIDKLRLILQNRSSMM